MRYAALIYGQNAHAEQADRRGEFAREYLELNDDARVVGGAQLHPVEMSTTVRVEDGEALLTDGPFIEAKEYLGGFYLLEADDLDSAIELATRIPAARIGGAVEIRPVVER